MGSGLAKCVLYRDCERDKIEREESVSTSSDQYSDKTSM